MLGAQVASAARDNAKRDRDGWFRCTIPIESVDQAVQELIRLGDDVEVPGRPSCAKKYVKPPWRTCAAMVHVPAPNANV